MILTATLLAALVAGGPGDSLPADLLRQRESAAWQLIATLQSPFCPGLTLESCPSWQAESLRTDIRRRMAGGESANRIKGDLVAAFGQRIVGEPTWSGFDVTGWVLPGVLVSLSTLMLATVLRYRRRHASRDVRYPAFIPPVEALPSAERLRLEELLRRDLSEYEEQ
ncbi:MAG TPA: cytochrome c-type biogenesis protein CcmH [Gemmatimonadales bacterium]|nr:cytochrome c-type biogenesis protein CcmH [Gemmatimonadales bacterium]